MSEKKRRIFKNYLINPSFQFRITIYFTVAAFASTAVVTLLFYKKFILVRSLLLTTSDVPLPVQMAVDGIMYDFIKVSLFSFLVMILGIVMVGILVTHRIAGPMYAILSYIEDLKSGKYHARRSLRPYDELSPIMNGLTELAENLSKK